jgi:hypothetical protein
MTVRKVVFTVGILSEMRNRQAPLMFDLCWRGFEVEENLRIWEVYTNLIAPNLAWWRQYKLQQSYFPKIRSLSIQHSNHSFISLIVAMKKAPEHGYPWEQSTFILNKQQHLVRMFQLRFFIKSHADGRNYHSNVASGERLQIHFRSFHDDVFIVAVTRNWIPVDCSQF